MHTAITTQPRSGLSKIELMGCLLAVVGGIWIGVSFFGVDLNKAAYLALDEVDLLDQVPEDWRPENPDCPNGDCPDPAEMARLAFMQLAEKRTTILDEINQRRIAAGLEPASLSATSPLTSESAESENPTIRYWEQLITVVTDVNDLQEEAAALEQSGHLGQAYQLCGVTTDYARDALDTLDTNAVDSTATQAAARLSSWYELSKEHTTEGVEIAKKLAGGMISPTESKSWKHAGLQLRMRSDLLYRKLEESRAALQELHATELSPVQPLGVVLTE